MYSVHHVTQHKLFTAFINASTNTIIYNNSVLAAPFSSSVRYLEWAHSLKMTRGIQFQVRTNNIIIIVRRHIYNRIPRRNVKTPLLVVGLCSIRVIQFS